MGLAETILSDLPDSPLSGLRRADALWQAYREGQVDSSTVITQSPERLGTTDWDVVICGGTLGLLMGYALVRRGWRVALLERGRLQGRSQEWNISRRELTVLLELQLLSQEELDAAIASEYNPARIAFHGGAELWVRDVLNVGVSPRALLDTLKAKFLAEGGHLLEQTGFESAIVHPDGVAVQAGGGFKTRLLLDAMGHFSPISRQARGSQRPDAVCLVVGTCAQGYPKNDTGDLFVSITPIANQCQYFWEAFPAHDGRTTYLFTYVDVHPSRPSLEQLFDEYFRLLPEYQDVALDQLQIGRSLHGFFPCYRQSPLQPKWDRILPIGDSSGGQSPLSFGGFGAMLRHLPRLTDGIHQALTAEQLNRSALALLQPYQPNLSVTWLFQRAMSVRVDQTVPPDRINQLLSAVFVDMEALGEPVLKPFLQDVVQFPALAQAMLRTSFMHPGMVLRVVPQVGVLTLLEWLFHYINLGLYAGLNQVGRSLRPWSKSLPPAWSYRIARWLDAWKYGSGGDYEDE
ncbi:MAG: lycopene cyclase family protein [Cyanobacteria bacterium J069]|nr:MAG: FAD-binding oxidoreductase [Cyanobacteria bacterium J069]